MAAGDLEPIVSFAGDEIGAGRRLNLGLARPAPSVPLKDVEWRLDSEPKEGRQGTRARFVPHLNARIAAALMDEWLGAGAWSDEYRTVTIGGKEAVLCTVSAWDGQKWIAKQDVGVPSNKEPQKGGISDAFKRTVTVKWGAGRNVYDLPTLWAPCKAVKGGDGKVRGYATDATLPDLHAQLKRLGFQDAEGKLEDNEQPETDSGPVELGTTTTLVETPGPDTHVEAPPSAAGESAGFRPVTPDSPAPSYFNPGKNALDKATSRCSALAAIGVDIYKARTQHKPKLPELKKLRDEVQWHEWQKLLDDLEVKADKEAETAGAAT